MRRIAVLASVAMLSVACLGSDFADSVEGSWQLASGTVNGEEIPILESHPVTMIFDGEAVTGTASCNGYEGSYELSGSTITFGNLAMTEMACMPEETMLAESLFAEGLTTVDTVSLDGDLTLSGSDTELTFQPLEG